MSINYSDFCKCHGKFPCPDKLAPPVPLETIQKILKEDYFGTTLSSHKSTKIVYPGGRVNDLPIVESQTKSQSLKEAVDTIKEIYKHRGESTKIARLCEEWLSKYGVK